MFKILLDLINNGIKEEDVNNVFCINDVFISDEFFKIKLKDADVSSVNTYDYI